MFIFMEKTGMEKHLHFPLTGSSQNKNLYSQLLYLFKNAFYLILEWERQKRNVE